MPGESLAELLARQGRHLHQPPEPPSAHNPQVDAALDAVVLTALAKDPAQRYQTALELEDALEQVLAGDAARTAPGSPQAGAPTGSTRAAATSPASTSKPSSTATPAPSGPGVQAALANLTAVVNAARQQGTADQEASPEQQLPRNSANAVRWTGWGEISGAWSRQQRG